MLKMIKGCRVPFADRLEEAYEVGEKRIFANVDADKIEEVVRHFITMHEEPQFFILELPASIDEETVASPGVMEKFHKNVYYIDGCSPEEALAILRQGGELLIHDGLCCFGFGCHKSQDEIMVGKYNVVTIYSHDIAKYHGFFERHGIPKVGSLLTAWDTFSREHPGTSEKYVLDGKDVYSLLEAFQAWEIYWAERREN